MHNLTSEYTSPLHEQEAMRVVFEQAGFGVAQVSLDGEWLAVNQTLCDILGYSRQALLSKTLQEITRFDNLQREAGNCRRLSSGELQTFSVQKRHLRGDGKVAWLKVTVTLARDNRSGGTNSYLAIVEDLTPLRKQVQRIQTEGDRRFRILADNISDLFFTLDADLNFTYWNKAAESLTGISLAEVIGKEVGEVFLHGLELPSAGEMYREVLATQQARSFTVRCAIDHTNFLFDVTAFPAKEGVYVVARDVAGHKEAQDALRRLAAIVEFNDDAILSLTPEKRISSWNRGAEKLYGFSAAEILGEDISCLIPVHLRSDAKLLRDRALAGIGVLGYETVHVRKDGTRVAVALSMSPIMNGRGSIIGISSIVRDITERKQAEDALRESEQRFRIMADSAPIMMWMAGLDKGYSDFNRGWLEFTGRTSEQETGEGWLAGVHPADRQNCIATYRAAFDQRRPFTLAYRLRRHDGEYRWMTDTGVPRFLPDGSFVGYIGCCIDVDDQKQGELARTELSRRLMTAQEAERTRIARELHDGIGQALALLSIQMQRAGQPAGPSGGKKGPGMAQLCAKLQEIGTQVSRLSHQLHSSELEFLGLAVAVKGLCREVSEQYSINVDCACTDVPEDLDNDIALCFLRVVQEALHNVAKHSRASSVLVEMRGTRAELVLNISDNGVGFELSDINKSSGLGMVSMRERMHLIRGEFAITSIPGSGTRIQARAPCRQPFES